MVSHNIKYTNEIPAQFFHYLLFYMKPDMVSIIISGIKYLPLNTHRVERYVGKVDKQS